ncbi:MAG: alpha/beta fold hydrolase [Candidatus Saccharibacteria bacterium]
MTPDIHTLGELALDVGDGHTLYVQDWGYQAAAMPIISLHGGPGSSAKDNHKSNFDPTSQRVIFFDQRGCGRSTPYATLEYNTTDDLVADIEKIADRLDLTTFMLVGGSWGSCLALAYALAHPKRVKAMMLHGIFTGSQAENDWLNDGQFHSFFPEVWKEYLAATPAEHRAKPSAYHFAQILGKNANRAKTSAYAFERLEGSLIKLDDRFRMEPIGTYDPSGIRLEVHYLMNGCFMPDNFILDHAERLKMPVWLVQGRYDMVCPPITAYKLHQKLPNSHLIWTLNGHKAEHEAATVLKLLLEQVSLGIS